MVRKNTQPQLSYEQIMRLVNGIATDLAEHPETAAMLMVLMQDISLYPTENAEAIANLLNSYLYMWTSGEHDDAQARYIAEKRASFISMIEGGTQ